MPTADLDDYKRKKKHRHKFKIDFNLFYLFFCRLADRSVFSVMQGKSVDEIYEKERTELAKGTVKRTSGYVSFAENQSAIAQQSSSNEAAKPFSNDNDNDRKPLLNSSSKSNVGTNALRENHDSVSAQKLLSNVSFSGRDQKNLSPYNDKSRSVSNLNKQNKLLMCNSVTSNILKVKRQISFDS